MSGITPQTRLTLLELMVLQRLAQGYSCRQIAYLLGRSEEGIRQAVLRARRRLDADSAIQAVAIAVTRGLVNVQREARDAR